MSIRYKCAFLLSFFFISALQHSTAQSNPKATRAQIDVKEWILKPNQTKPTLKNKIVLLEFWATWCIPCINAFPHMNALSDKFTSNEVAFVSMNSYDSPESIRRFLKKKKLKTLVAADNNKSTLNIFGVTLLPKTFLLNKQGKIVWSGEPGQLTEKLLQTYIKTGKLIEQETPELAFSYNIANAADRSLSRISKYSGDEFGFKFENKDANTILGQLLKFSNREDNEFRFSGPIPLEPKVDLNFRASTRLNKDEVYQSVFRNLSYTFSFTQDTIKELQTVVELSIVNKKRFQAHVAAPDEKSGQRKEGDLAVLKRASAFKIKRHIKYLSNLPVYFQDAPKGYFNITYYHSDFEKTKKHFLEKYGIQLAVVEKEIEVVVIGFE